MVLYLRAWGFLGAVSETFRARCRSPAWRVGYHLQQTCLYALRMIIVGAAPIEVILIPEDTQVPAKATVHCIR